MNPNRDAILARLSKAMEDMCRNTLSEADLNFLARFCQAIARSLMLTCHKKHLNNFAHAEYDADAAAWRCIEDLFLPDGEMRCAELRRSIIAAFPAILDTPPEELVIFLRRIVGRKTHQTISELYGELDADFRRILRNVSRHVKHSGRFTAYTSVHGVMIHGARIDTLRHLPVYPEEELRREFFAIKVGYPSVPNLVDALFQMMNMQSSYRRMLSLIALTAIIRDWYALSREETREPCVEYVPGEDSRIIESLATLTGRHVDTTLLARYESRGVIKDADREKLRDAVMEIIIDHADGDRRPLVEYYSERFPDVDYTTYRKRHRARFEYIMVVAREYFRELCAAQLGICSTVSADKSFYR